MARRRRYYYSDDDYRVSDKNFDRGEDFVANYPLHEFYPVVGEDVLYWEGEKSLSKAKTRKKSVI